MIGKPGEKTPYGKCDACGKSAPTANLWTTKDGCNVCLDCAMALPGEGGDGGGGSVPTPPIDTPLSDYDRLLNLAHIAANAEGNWKTRRPGGELIVWDAYPPLHVTARRLLEEIEG